MTTTDYDALEKRLRQQAEEHFYAGYAGYDVTMKEAADAIRELRAERDALAKDAEVEQWRQRHREDCEIRTNNPACTCDFFTKGGEFSPAIRAALAAQEKP